MGVTILTVYGNILENLWSNVANVHPLPTYDVTVISLFQVTCVELLIYVNQSIWPCASIWHGSQVPTYVSISVFAAQLFACGKGAVGICFHHLALSSATCWD